VDEQVTLDRLGIDGRRPPAAADLVALVVTIPGELDTGATVPCDRAAVQPAADGDGAELAGPVPGELDETRFDQIDGIAVPPAHPHDPPPTNQHRRGSLNAVGHEPAE
jgi:hypothetical protein